MISPDPLINLGECTKAQNTADLFCSVYACQTTKLHRTTYLFNHIYNHPTLVLVGSKN